MALPAAHVTDPSCQLNWQRIGLLVYSGKGTPEARVTAGIGATYHRLDGGASTSFYVKESGIGNTGWVAK